MDRLRLYAEAQNRQEKGKGTWHKAALFCLGTASFACQVSPKASPNGKNKPSVQDAHIQWWNKATCNFTTSSYVFCQSPASHLLSPISTACLLDSTCLLSPLQWCLFSVLLRSSCVRPKIHQYRMDANITLHLLHWYCRKKLSVFRAEKSYLVLLTNSWIEVIQFCTGSIQLEKQKTNQTFPPLKFRIHYIHKY